MIDKLKIASENRASVFYELLIHIHATQIVHTQMLFDYLEDKGGQRKELEKIFERNQDIQIDELKKQLYEKYGDIDNLFSQPKED